MPTSRLECAPRILNLIWHVKQEEVRFRPLRVLDVGPGWGKYGVLIREYVDHDAIVDCLEAEPRYLDHPRMALTYDHRRGGDVLKRDLVFSHYDVVLMVDVIEHLPKVAALRMLDRMAKCWIVVCTPLAFFQNPEASQGWETERHRSLWSIQDFQDTGRCDWSGTEHGAVLARLRPTGG